MRGIIAYLRGARDMKMTTLWCFLAIFAVFLPGICGRVYILLTADALPGWLFTLFNIIGASISGIFLYLMLGSLFKKMSETDLSANQSESTDENEDSSELPQISTATIFSDKFVVFSVVLLWGVLICIASGFSMYLLPTIKKLVPSNIAEVTQIFGKLQINYVIALIFSVICLMIFCSAANAAIFATLYSQPLKKTLGVWCKNLVLLLKSPGMFWFSIIFTCLSGILIAYLDYFTGILLTMLSVSAIPSELIKGAVLSSVLGMLLIVYGVYTTNIFKNRTADNENFLHLEGGNASFVFAALILIVAIFISLPSRISWFDVATETIDREFKLAEGYKADNRINLAITHYNNGQNLALAAKGYLKVLSAEQDKSMSDADKNKIKSEGMTAIQESEAASPGIGLIYFIDAEALRFNKQDSQALSKLEQCAAYLPDFPNANLVILASVKKTGDVKRLALIKDKIFRSGKLTAYGTLNNLNGKGIADLSAKLDIKLASIKNDSTLLAYYYFENKLYIEAQGELKKLSTTMPDDMVVNYLNALTDLEMKSDGKPYTDALNAADKLIKLYPNEKWTLDLKTYVASRAGRSDIMENALLQAYTSKPDDIDIAEQYAYSLMSKNQSFNYTDEDKKADDILDKVIAKDANRWFSNYCKAVLSLKKKDYVNSLQSLGKFATNAYADKELAQFYDEFFYAYVLKYKMFMSYPQATKALEDIKDDATFTYDYIQGAYFWSQQDYDKARQFLSDSIELRPGLSKPHFLLGTVFFEQSVIKNVPSNLPLAVDEYKKSLAIFEEDTYTWFSLGHVYKRMQRLEDALGAFKKAVYYMPQEDHNFDYYGVSIHSKMQVDEIQSQLNKQGG